MKQHSLETHIKFIIAMLEKVYENTDFEIGMAMITEPDNSNLNYYKGQYDTTGRVLGMLNKALESQQ